MERLAKSALTLVSVGFVDTCWASGDNVKSLDAVGPEVPVRRWERDGDVRLQQFIPIIDWLRTRPSLSLTGRHAVSSALTRRLLHARVATPHRPKSLYS